MDIHQIDPIHPRGLAVIGSDSNLLVSEEPFSSGEEHILETVLESHPELLPIEELNPSITAAIPIGRQVTVGNNCVDLLFVADTGHLLVIECKLIQNPEARREVVPQLLEYFLTIRGSWDSGHVSSLAQEYFLSQGINGAARTTMADRLCRLKSGNSEQQVLTASLLEARISRHLQNPILIIVGNRIEQRALVLTDYLRTLNVPISCVEVRRYNVGTVSFATAYVRAASLISAISASHRISITEEQWLALDDQELIQLLRKDFLDWAKGLADQGLVQMRIGSTQLMIEVTSNDRTANILSLDNRLYLNFSECQRLGIPVQRIADFRQEIDNIVGRGTLTPAAFWPSFPLASLADDMKRTSLKTILETLIRETLTRAQEESAR